jgi:hypothetical protein
MVVSEKDIIRGLNKAITKTSGFYIAFQAYDEPKPVERLLKQIAFMDSNSLVDILGGRQGSYAVDRNESQSPYLLTYKTLFSN